MRGVQAKRLRRVAREATKGAPHRRLCQHPQVSSSAVNDPASTRGVYRSMKKIFRSFGR